MPVYRDLLFFALVEPFGSRCPNTTTVVALAAAVESDLLQSWLSEIGIVCEPLNAQFLMQATTSIESSFMHVVLLLTRICKYSSVCSDFRLAMRCSST